MRWVFVPLALLSMPQQWAVLVKFWAWTEDTDRPEAGCFSSVDDLLFKRDGGFAHFARLRRQRIHLSAIRGAFRGGLLS